MFWGAFVSVDGLMEVADCCGSQYSTWKAVSCLEASAMFTTDKLLEHSLTILSHFVIHEKLYFVALWTTLKSSAFPAVQIGTWMFTRLNKAGQCNHQGYIPDAIT